MDTKPFHESDTEIDLIARAMGNFWIIQKTNDENIINRISQFAFIQLTELTSRDETLGRLVSSVIRASDRNPLMIIEDDGSINLQYDNPSDGDRITRQWIVNRNHVHILRGIFKHFIYSKP